MTKESDPYLANLDLNLLVFLRELLHARNVTQAAERIGVTQPTASAALARLRRHFGDELLVRRKGGYVLSSLAVQLAAQVEPVCEAAQRLFTTSAGFDPRTSDREFSLLMTDYVVAAVGERLSRVCYGEAPGVRLHLSLVTEALPDDLVETLRLTDALISASTSRLRVRALHCAELFRDRWVCVVSADTVSRGATRLRHRQLEQRPWVVPHQPDGGYPPSAQLAPIMDSMDTRPAVAVRVDSYAVTPHFVAGTDRVAVVQERLVHRFAGRTDLRVLELPWEPGPVVEYLWWHEKNEDDQAHRWMRETIVRAARAATDEV